jgi:ABC-2 type transport system ATP-binding protein
MLSVEGLAHRFGVVVAVDGVSFDVPAGELVGFLGPNGAGKTTTLRALAGTLRPDAGRVIVAGVDASANPIGARRAVGYLPENNPLYEEAEVGAHLEWVARVHGWRGPEAQRRVRAAIERCGLGGLAARPIGALSKGQRQRAGLAAAILPDPPVLLLDEPTAGLDPNQAADVRRLVVELKASKTVLLSTHQMSEAEEVCDRVIIIHRGRIAAQGRPGEIAAAGAARLRVALAASADGEGVARALRALPGARAAEARRAGTEWVVTLEAEPGGDLRAAVFAAAARGGWPLLELARERADLDEAFRSLTA